MSKRMPLLSTAQHMRWHRLLGWLGAMTLLSFGLSGLSHPLMTWFGPQQALFFPPQALFSEAELAAVPRVLEEHAISQAQQLKVLPTPEGAMLQLSDNDGRLRRYFDLDSTEERPGFDQRQAEWLARYYTGLADTDITAMTLQTAFDRRYPAVNRLLPVWRVEFDTADRLSAYVHTELNALATLSNHSREWQQALFLSLHTWDWLAISEPLRVGLLTVLLLALLVMLLSGLVMIWRMKARPLPPGRRWHRRLAQLLWLPLLAFSFSGLYHLLQNAGDDELQGLSYPAPVSFAGLSALPAGALHIHGPLNSISLLAGPQALRLYRLSEPAGQPAEAVGHHGRFAGTPTEQASRLLDAANGHTAEIDDEGLARYLAGQYLGLKPGQIRNSSLVTAFGTDYDFRNKRLPVWRIDYAGEADKGSVFIDPASGALVDRIKRREYLERLSFSHLHKWNFMTALMGRQLRDALSVLVIGMAMGLSIVGMLLLWRRQRLRP